MNNEKIMVCESSVRTFAPRTWTKCDSPGPGAKITSLLYRVYYPIQQFRHSWSPTTPDLRALLSMYQNNIVM